MSNVELFCKKSFSKVDREIVDSFIEFLQSLIDKDSNKLNEIVFDESEFVEMFGKPQSKEEFISEVAEGALNFSKSEIFDPTILFDDDNTASLIAKVRLSVEINDRELRLISNSVVSFKKIGEKWNICKWDN